MSIQHYVNREVLKSRRAANGQGPNLARAINAYADVLCRRWLRLYGKKRVFICGFWEHLRFRLDGSAVLQRIELPSHYFTERARSRYEIMTGSPIHHKTEAALGGQASLFGCPWVAICGEVHHWNCANRRVEFTRLLLIAGLFRSLEAEASYRDLQSQFAAVA